MFLTRGWSTSRPKPAFGGFHIRWPWIFHGLSPCSKENSLKLLLQSGISVGGQVGNISTSYAIKLIISWVGADVNRKAWPPLQCPSWYPGEHWDQGPGGFPQIPTPRLTEGTILQEMVNRFRLTALGVTFFFLFRFSLSLSEIPGHSVQYPTVPLY